MAPRSQENAWFQTPPPRHGKRALIERVHSAAVPLRRAETPVVPDSEPSRAWSDAPPATQQLPSSPFNVRVIGVAGGDRVTRYLVRLQCLHRPDLRWEVSRRYSEFDALAHLLQGPLSVPMLPPKGLRMLQSQAERDRRVLGLERFCHGVLGCPRLLTHAAVGPFFELDFGLWHTEPSERAETPSVGRALENATVLIQAHARRWRVQRGTARRRHERARLGAAMRVQAAVRRRQLGASASTQRADVCVGPLCRFLMQPLPASLRGSPAPLLAACRAACGAVGPPTLSALGDSFVALVAIAVASLLGGADGLPRSIFDQA
jgi:hypothetical protein